MSEELTVMSVTVMSDKTSINCRPHESPGIRFRDALAAAIERFAPYQRSYSFCHYQIIDNKVTSLQFTRVA